jgi:hypothetical protein
MLPPVVEYTYISMAVAVPDSVTVTVFEFISALSPTAYEPMVVFPVYVEHVQAAKMWKEKVIEKIMSVVKHKAVFFILSVSCLFPAQRIVFSGIPDIIQQAR